MASKPAPQLGLHDSYMWGFQVQSFTKFHLELEMIEMGLGQIVPFFVQELANMGQGMQTSNRADLERGGLSEKLTQSLP